MIEIELTEPKNSVWECCGGVMTNLTRFVCKDGNAFAIYHATFSENYRESGVLLAIGIDDKIGRVKKFLKIVSLLPVSCG